MKKYLGIFLFVIAFLFNLSIVEAKQVEITGNAVKLRSGSSTSFNSLAYLYSGEKYTLVDDTLYTGTGCTEGWRKISHNAGVGYVCAKYTKIIEEAPVISVDCKKQMADLGFPESYWDGLCSLKSKHSNWNFVALQTNLDWTTSVNKESTCGKSFIETSNSNYIDSSCTNPYTKTWYPASKTAVAYYMDPRNWFTEQHIFQFNYLKYDKNLSSSYQNGVQAIIKTKNFYKYHLSINNDLAEIIDKAGAETDVSPIFLGARMAQENVAEVLYRGDTPGYEGYYNFFNYNVTDTCATTHGLAYCGLGYAKTKGWDSPLNAIKGGASSLSASYINVGQYTGYLQKYNVVPTNISKLYTHQYMTNVAAPSSESRSTYNSYNSLGLLNESFTFYIPVYLNMDEKINNSGSGANNEGDSSNLSSSSISTIVTSTGYKYTTGYMSGVLAGTSVNEVKTNIESVSGSGSVVITDANGKSVSGDIATGYKISIKNSSTTEVLSIVVKGDTSGDGKVNALDLLQVQKSILGTYKLTDAYQKAGDTSGDGNVNALDLLQIQKSILGTYEIK